jgi:hypothetical protein
MFALSHCLTHPRRNRRWTRGAASHAASRGAVAFGAPPTGRLVLSGRRHRWCERGSLPALPRNGGGCRTPRVSREARGKRGPTHRQGLIQVRALPPKRARIGRSRSCSRVVDVVAEVDRQWPAQRSGRTSISPDLEAFRDGRLARSSNVRKYAAAGKETLAPSSQRKTSRDRFRERVRPAHGAGGWRWKASRIVWRADLHGPLACHGLGRLDGIALRASEARATGKRQGCQRYGGIGSARKKNAA